MVCYFKNYLQNYTFSQNYSYHFPENYITEQQHMST